MKKKVTLLCAAALISMFASTISFASEWKQEADGRWQYQNDDGSHAANGWQVIDGKYYYFDAEGWMLANTTTPDGYQVGSDGALIQNDSNDEQNSAGKASNSNVQTMTARQLGFFTNSNGKLYFKNHDLLKKHPENLRYNILSIGRDDSMTEFDEFVIDMENNELMGEGWYWTYSQPTNEYSYCYYVNSNYMVVKNYTSNVGPLGSEGMNMTEFKTDSTGALSRSEGAYITIPVNNGALPRISASNTQTAQPQTSQPVQSAGQLANASSIGYNIYPMVPHTAVSSFNFDYSYTTYAFESVYCYANPNGNLLVRFPYTAKTHGRTPSSEIIRFEFINERGLPVYKSSFAVFEARDGYKTYEREIPASELPKGTYKLRIYS